ncbi:precorrin-6Y C5,15-methyltransferase (decarboxylating) subunit CbiT [Poseidonibacter sp.]|uniref:precorrin-6Y C5,15-methyltransferase (decarboxylating) subunit CbiT n=1 Tax=Poseidonibacter sp. TaxID=2321188 RepID=UPI003C783774
MVTIAGNGMGAYDFTNLELNFCNYDKIICDPNFIENGRTILKLKFKDAKEYILQNYKKENILYVVTGSPLFFSAGTLIANKLPKEEVKIVNNISSKTYLLEKLFISENDVSVISIHGRKNIDLCEFMNKKYTFVLCDKYSINRLQEAMQFFEEEFITTNIAYKLGFKDEIIEEVNIFNFDENRFDLKEPFVLLIKRNYEHKKNVCDDLEFETERGMITKKYKRHLSLQNLDLEENNILWDIGAGSGSCGIEAYKRYKVKTIFFEKNETRVEFIKENLKNHHVCDCKLYIGQAEEIYPTLEQNPQRIFVGGGGKMVIDTLPYLYERLDVNGIMLINAITLKHLSQMIEVLNKAKIEYDTHSISLTTYKGVLDLVEPERQLFQIKIYKNEEK